MYSCRTVTPLPESFTRIKLILTVHLWDNNSTTPSYGLKRTVLLPKKEALHTINRLMYLILQIYHLQQKTYYKQLLACKEKEAMKSIWAQLIQAVNSNDSTSFCHITSSLPKQCSIQVWLSHSSCSVSGIWEIYCQKLFTDTRPVSGIWEIYFQKLCTDTSIENGRPD